MIETWAAAYLAAGVGGQKCPVPCGLEAAWWGTFPWAEAIICHRMWS